MAKNSKNASAETTSATYKSTMQESAVHEAIELRELDKQKELDLAVTLLLDALNVVNEQVGTPLYDLDADREHHYLSDVSHLYGAFDKTTNVLVGIIAVEEDAIERIAVQPKLWRRGIGAEMMRAMRSTFDAEYVDVFALNSEALAFFEAQGMAMFDETAPETGDLMAKSPHKVIHLMY